MLPEMKWWITCNLCQLLQLRPLRSIRPFSGDGSDGSDKLKSAFVRIRLSWTPGFCFKKQGLKSRISCERWVKKTRFISSPCRLAWRAPLSAIYCFSALRVKRVHNVPPQERCALLCTCINCKMIFYPLEYSIDQCTPSNYITSIIHKYYWFGLIVWDGRHKLSS